MVNLLTSIINFSLLFLIFEKVNALKCYECGVRGGVNCTIPFSASAASTCNIEPLSGFSPVCTVSLFLILNFKF